MRMCTYAYAYVYYCTCSCMCTCTSIYVISICIYAYAYAYRQACFHTHAGCLNNTGMARDAVGYGWGGCHSELLGGGDVEAPLGFQIWSVEDRFVAAFLSILTTVGQHLNPICMNSAPTPIILRLFLTRTRHRKWETPTTDAEKGPLNPQTTIDRWLAVSWPLVWALALCLWGSEV